MPGWLVANNGLLTVALDIEVTEQLLQEGIARELINRIQNLRKSAGLEITDRIRVEIERNDNVNAAVENYRDYICSQVLAYSLQLVEQTTDGDVLDFEDFNVTINLKKA